MLSRFYTDYLQRPLTKAIKIIQIENNTDPHLQKITELNNATQTVKELDSTTNLLPDADKAINTLQRWKDTRDTINKSLSSDNRQEKLATMQDAANKFLIAKYLMITLSVTNILTMFYLFSQNEQHRYVDNEMLDTLCKLPGRLTIVGALEGSIHLYKAKRFYVQKHQIAQAEIASITLATQNDSPKIN